ncbi:MAG TPA: tetratricopeptide repeat protein [Bacteroidia bacterium]|jgi:tetratricopeptide (TPR) repeat protein|nr:tetratricopeptide repeat protein [Bacteroidia bacterium]
MKTLYNFICYAILAPAIISCQNNDKVENGIKYDESAVVASTKDLSAATSYNIGYAAFHSGNYKQAIKLYRKAIEIDPKYVDAYDNCGLSYRRLGILDSAEYFYKESIKIYPQGTTSHGNLAIVYTERGQNDKAIQEYEVLAKYNPNDPESYYGQAGVYIDMKEYDKAIPLAKKSIDLFEKYKPEYAGDAYYYVGLAYLKLKDKVKAKEYINKAVQKGSTPPPNIMAELESK